MEQVQPLGPHPLALDSVWVQGASAEGAWLVAGVARRPRRQLDAVCLVGVPGLGTLKLPRHPDTLLVASNDVFGGEGLLIRLVEPMVCWKINYAVGPMRLDETGELVDVVLDLTFTSTLPCFDFDTDMAPRTVARAMAREPWSREFFARLRDAHQTHYEQIGTTRGRVTVRGREYALSP
ncbi:uncharacterized protein LOC119104721 [Pollicipes pollicipes]|uniref:uncharacterized protein LOC119104721 n=1 Tax=Pollicipes pollicipes TaxID=41117 RepID=UPI001884D9B1|nr:uncharacterized protein LOC119104721 [Pollicipes pollicipes]